MRKLSIILLFLSLFFACHEVKRDYKKELCRCVQKNDPRECEDLLLKYEEKSGLDGEDLECFRLAIVTSNGVEEAPAITSGYLEEVEAPAESLTEIKITGKLGWDMNNIISGVDINTGEQMSLYYSAWYPDGTRGIMEYGINWDDIIINETYEVKFSIRNWVENYETGGWENGNFIISIFPID
tara:strand:+ start:12441 stop:12989 length:549 start_codon:yes stop_codon:yes gene_type:complete